MVARIFLSGRKVVCGVSIPSKNKEKSASVTLPKSWIPVPARPVNVSNA